MSKLGPLINGDSTALSDAIVGSMEGRAMRSRDFLREDYGEKFGKMFSCDVDHMYANVSDSVQSKDREIIQLKELLVVHLDLIQRQSELIVSRDKEISTLREERDMLLQRFQRMERRVTLQKHRDEPAVAGPAPSMAELPPSVMLPLLSPQASPSSPAPAPVAKRRRISTGSIVKRKRRTISGGSDRTKRSYDSNVVSDNERRSRLRVPLTSDSMYFTAAGDEKDVWTPVDLRVPPDPLPQGEEFVQVPSWREKVLSPLYVIEGTENLEDEVFLKRHQKLESAERRRKRWDIQRIREQTHVEKLKQRGLKGRGKGGSSTPASPERQVFSFFPTIDDVEEVSVEPNLPVVAFGLPLRVFDSCEFNLAWNLMQTGQKYLNLRHR